MSISPNSEMVRDAGGAPAAPLFPHLHHKATPAHHAETAAPPGRHPHRGPTERPLCLQAHNLHTSAQVPQRLLRP